MKRKVLFLIAITSLLLSALCFLSCKKTSLPDSSSQSPSPSIELFISETNVSLIIGKTYSLKVTDGKNILKCNWTSSDDRIARVNESGVITAVREGTVTIFADVQGNKTSCEVTVGLGGKLPVLETEAGDELQVDLSHSADVSARVFFDGNYYDDGEITYKLADNSFGKVVGGVFKPIKAGKLTITVSASWRDVKSDYLTTEIEVTIIHSVNLYANGKPLPDEVNIYTTDSFDGNEYETEWQMTPSMDIDGIEKTPTITIDNPDIIEYDETAGLIIAKKQGAANVIFSYNGEEADITKSVAVNVIRPIAVYPETVKDFSALNGEFRMGSKNLLTELFADGVVYAEQDGNVLDISQTGKVLGIKTDKSGISTFEVTVLGEKYGYTFELEGCSLVIKEANDLLDFRLTSDKKTIDGYIVMKNDVDMSALDINGDGKTAATGSVAMYDTFYPYYLPGGILGATDMLSGAGFTGIFEGNGYAIKNYHAGNSYGFFGSITGATVRNVAFTDVEMYPSYALGIVFAKNADNVKMQNVYVSVNIGDQTDNNYVNTKNSMFFATADKTNISFEKCIIEYNATYATDSLAGWSGASVGIFGSAGTTNYYVDYPTYPGYLMKYSIKGLYFIAPKADNGRVMPLIQYNGLTVYASNDFIELGERQLVKFDSLTKNPIADQAGNQKVYHWGDAYRYDSFAALYNAGITKIGSWLVSESGIVFDK